MGYMMSRLHSQQVETGRTPVRYKAHSLTAAIAFLSETAHDGDTVVMADQSLAQIVESTAIGLGLNLFVEVDRTLLP